MRRFSIFLAPLALLFALSLAACGNKGPLVRASDAEQMEEAEVEEDVDVDGDVADDDAADDDAAVDEVDADPVEGAEDPVEVPPPPADPGNG